MASASLSGCRPPSATGRRSFGSRGSGLRRAPRRALAMPGRVGGSKEEGVGSGSGIRPGAGGGSRVSSSRVSSPSSGDGRAGSTDWRGTGPGWRTTVSASPGASAPASGKPAGPPTTVGPPAGALSPSAGPTPRRVGGAAAAGATGPAGTGACLAVRAPRRRPQWTHRPASSEVSWAQKGQKRIKERNRSNLAGGIKGRGRAARAARGAGAGRRA